MARGEGRGQRDLQRAVDQPGRVACAHQRIPPAGVVRLSADCGGTGGPQAKPAVHQQRVRPCHRDPDEGPGDPAQPHRAWPAFPPDQDQSVPSDPDLPGLPDRPRPGDLPQADHRGLLRGPDDHARHHDRVVLGQESPDVHQEAAADRGVLQPEDAVVHYRGRQVDLERLWFRPLRGSAGGFQPLVPPGRQAVPG
ncbi:hypothetical protein D3C78_867200 [compost metagenome]